MRTEQNIRLIRRLASAGMAALLALLASCGGRPPARESGMEQPPLRIVSMAPSITEILFALDLGDRVAGVTAFCRYPPETAGLPVVGGYYDVNYEMIFSLTPDLILLTVENDVALERLRALNLNCQAVDTATIPAIFAAITTIGELCGVDDRAKKLALYMRREMDNIIDRIESDGVSPSVLISIGRNMGSGNLSGVYLAGPGTLYDEMLAMLNALNVFQGGLPYAQIGQEGILRMNPDVIIDLAPALDQADSAMRARVRDDWNELVSVNAVRDGRVSVLGGDYVCVPGPRITRTFEDIARAIYPDKF